VEAVLPELQGCKSLDNEIEISRREREVLDLLLDNLSNKEIASRLFVAERTVKFHVSHLLSKFKVQRRADLIVLWMQQHRNTYTWLAHAADNNISMPIN
jgi:DNA-binding CsgD family transcriptional regulator